MGLQVMLAPPPQRLAGWSIVCAPGTGTGAGNVCTLERDGNGWWGSGDCFEMRGDEWEVLPWDSQHAPLPVEGTPPELIISFTGPTLVRGIAIIARNVPRSCALLPDLRAEQEWDHAQIISRRAVSEEHVKEAGSPEYFRRVAELMPHGKPAPAAVQGACCHLPSVLEPPILCERALHIRLLSSQEGGWVGINRIALFGQPL